MPLIHIASSIPMLISVKISSQFQTFTVVSISNLYNHVNFKPLQSCQFQTFTIMSISNLNGPVNFKTPAVMSVNFNLFLQNHSSLVIGQVASSHPRTACACQFTLVIGQVASSHSRTACTCQFAFIFVIGQAAGSNSRTACTCVLLLSSAKRPVRIQEQLVPLLLVSIPGQVPSSSQKNNLHLSICYLVSPVSLVICYLVNVYQSRNGYDISCYLLFCQCLPIPQWIRHILLNLIFSLSCIHDSNVARHTQHLQTYFYAQNQC